MQMLRINPRGSLDCSTFAQSVTGQNSAVLEIALDGCTFLRPAGLVLLGVALDVAANRRIPVRLTTGSNPDVARYGSRMGLRELSERCEMRGATFPQVNTRASDDRFIQLTNFDRHGDSVIEDVARLVAQRADD